VDDGNADNILALSSDVIWSQKALLFLKIQWVRNEDENYADAGNENSAILTAMYVLTFYVLSKNAFEHNY